MQSPCSENDHVVRRTSCHTVPLICPGCHCHLCAVDIRAESPLAKTLVLMLFYQRLARFIIGIGTLGVAENVDFCFFGIQSQSELAAKVAGLIDCLRSIISP